MKIHIPIISALMLSACASEQEDNMAHIYMHPQTETFTKQINSISGETWGFSHVNSAGHVIQSSDGRSEIFTKAPNVKHNTQGAVELLSWYQSIKHKEGSYKIVEAIFGDTQIYCNYAVSLFRTLLKEKGFYSRPIILEYEDNYGGKSHTTMEVWDEEAQKWVWIDPHFFAYNEDLSFLEVLDQKPNIQLLPLLEDEKTLKNRPDEMQDLLFGEQGFIYLRHEPTSHIYEYRSPTYYSMPDSIKGVKIFKNKNGKRFYHLVLPRT